MALYKNKYRSDSFRLKNYDYSTNGYYFITICTKNNQHLFGEIRDSKMDFNPVGKLAEALWLHIPTQFPYARIDAFVVMPNHIHGILEIAHNEKDSKVKIQNLDDDGVLIQKNSCSGDDLEDRDYVGSGIVGILGEDALSDEAVVGDAFSVGDAMNRIGTGEDGGDADFDGDAFSVGDAMNRIGTGKDGGIAGNYNPMLHENVSRIIRWYKGRMSFEARKLNPKFSWHSLFYDCIIRNEKAFVNIRNYIDNNPKMWDLNKNNASSLKM